MIMEHYDEIPYEIMTKLNASKINATSARDLSSSEGYANGSLINLSA